MHILSCPVEILSEIIYWTLPDGFEAFALSCKTIYACATPQIRRHNSLKKAWTRVVGGSVDVLIRLVGDADIDPIATQYVKDLDLQTPMPDYRRYPKVIWERAETIEDVIKAKRDRQRTNSVKNAVTRSKYLAAGHVDSDHWWETMEKTGLINEPEFECEIYTRTAIVSLLGLLPNLETLSLPTSWSDRDEDEQDSSIKAVQSVLDAMVDGANTGAGALAKLQIMMPFYNAGCYRRAGLQDIEPFLKLAALRELYLVSCVAVNDSSEKTSFHEEASFKWHFENFNSHLTRIELAHCCMDAAGISELLAHTPELKVFKYSHEYEDIGCEYRWNPGSLVEAIGWCVGPILTELAVTVDSIGEAGDGVSSFHPFLKLEKLEVDALIFCGPPVESAECRGLTTIRPEPEGPWKVEELPCLASMLPESLTDLRINVELPEGSTTDVQKPKYTASYEWQLLLLEVRAFGALLTDFDHQIKTRSRHLETIVIGTYNVDTAQEIMKSVGAHIDICREEDICPRIAVEPRSTIPAWKREFNKRTGVLNYSD